MKNIFKKFKSKKNPQILAKEVWEKYDIDYLKKDLIGKINRSKIDDNINTFWLNKYKQTLKDIYNNFTLEEEVYFTDSFFKNLPDYLIAEKLNLTNESLQSIKNSCLVKTWNEFHVTNKLV